MFENDPRIQSPELARVMADAEVPYRNLAMKALDHDYSEEHIRSLIDVANEASNEAARSYIAQLSVNLSFHEKELPPEKESEGTVRATREDMVEFGLEDDDPKMAQANMKRIWSALSLSDQYLVSRFPDQFIKGPHARHRGLLELHEVLLTQPLVDASINLRNIGPKQQALLQAYFDARRTVDSE